MGWGGLSGQRISTQNVVKIPLLLNVAVKLMTDAPGTWTVTLTSDRSKFPLKAFVERSYWSVIGRGVSLLSLAMMPVPVVLESQKPSRVPSRARAPGSWDLYNSPLATSQFEESVESASSLLPLVDHLVIGITTLLTVAYPARPVFEPAAMC